MVAKLLINKVSALFGGIAGWAVSTILGYAGYQIINFGVALARGAINRGVDIHWNWNVFKSAVGVTYSVR